MTGGEFRPEPDVLLAALRAAVPVWAERAAGWTPEKQRQRAGLCGDVIAGGADVLFRPGHGYSRQMLRRSPGMEVRGRRTDAGPLPRSAGPPGKLRALTVQVTGQDAGAAAAARDYVPAEVFNAVAEGLGIGSLVPGGVTFLGAHWCTDPDGHDCPNRGTA